MHKHKKCPSETGAPDGNEKDKGWKQEKTQFQNAKSTKKSATHLSGFAFKVRKSHYE